MKRCLFVILISLGALSQASADETPARSSQAPLRPIPALDVPRYLGTWYEIAKYPNGFQRKCVSGTRAEYTPIGEGRLQVSNRCRTANGETIEAVGVARQIGSATSAKLEVRFAPAWLSLLPFVWGDYWVIDLDDAYTLAAVSEPKREYLWILARTPKISADRYAALLERLRGQGFDLDKLEITRQE